MLPFYDRPSLDIAGTLASTRKGAKLLHKLTRNKEWNNFEALRWWKHSLIWNWHLNWRFIRRNTSRNTWYPVDTTPKPMGGLLLKIQANLPSSNSLGDSKSVRITEIQIIEILCWEVFKGPEKFRSNWQKFELAKIRITWVRIRQRRRYFTDQEKFRNGKKTYSTLQRAKNMNNGTVISAKYQRHPIVLTVPMAIRTAKIEPTDQNNWKIRISTIH